MCWWYAAVWRADAPEVWLGRSSPSFQRSVSGPSPAVRSCKTKETAAVETGNPSDPSFANGRQVFYWCGQASSSLALRGCLGTSLDMLSCGAASVSRGCSLAGTNTCLLSGPPWHAPAGSNYKPRTSKRAGGSRRTRRRGQIRPKSSVFRRTRADPGAEWRPENDSQARRVSSWQQQQRPTTSGLRAPSILLSSGEDMSGKMSFLGKQINDGATCWLSIVQFSK